MDVANDAHQEGRRVRGAQGQVLQSTTLITVLDCKT